VVGRRQPKRSNFTPRGFPRSNYQRVVHVLWACKIRSVKAVKLWSIGDQTKSNKPWKRGICRSEQSGRQLYEKEKRGDNDCIFGED